MVRKKIVKNEDHYDENRDVFRKVSTIISKIDREIERDSNQEPEAVDLIINVVYYFIVVELNDLSNF